MIIVAGHLTVDPADRDRYVDGFRAFVERARRADGCLDLAITADPVDPGRINNFERWRSEAQVRAFRGVADPPELGIAIIDGEVREFRVDAEREPFADSWTPIT